MSDTDNGMDLEALRDGLRGVLSEQASHEKVAAFTDAQGVLNAELWGQASELGWLALSAPEEQGGLGLGPAELAVVYEELGRQVAPLPVLGSLLVVEALTRDAERQASWIERLASGELIGATTQLTPQSLATDLVLAADGEDVVLNGPTGLILDGAAASLLLLLARDGETLRWVLVEPAADGVVVERIETMDRTRHLGRAVFENLRLPRERLLAGDAHEIAEVLVRHAGLALAADAMGGAAAILDITLEYLKTRQQFGKPIGSFQALKHRCADHKIALVAAQAYVSEAVAKARSGALEADRYALSAKVLACDVFVRIAQDAVQLHGGIGYTWEHPCHLYLKRAKLNEQLFGGPTVWLDAVSDRLLAAA